MDDETGLWPVSVTHRTPRPVLPQLLKIAIKTSEKTNGSTEKTNGSTEAPLSGNRIGQGIRTNKAEETTTEASHSSNYYQRTSPKPTKPELRARGITFISIAQVATKIATSLIHIRSRINENANCTRQQIAKKQGKHGKYYSQRQTRVCIQSD